MAKRAPVIPGTLYVVGTPIGNLEDITYRAVRVLGEVDLVAAEDTRSARTLMTHCGIKTSTVSFFLGNEARRGEELIERLSRGESVALISESGMPGISDPGGRLIAKCIASDIDVDVIPGPSAALAALVLSGLPTERFTFLGFLPRTVKQRRRILAQLPFEPATLIVYEAPTRVGQTLKQLLEALGDRPAALVRELTKMHQEVVRGELSALVDRYSKTHPRGEVTLVVAGADDAQEIPVADINAEIKQRLDQGQSPREIADALSAHGRRTVYQTALAMKRDEAR